MNTAKPLADNHKKAVGLIILLCATLVLIVSAAAISIAQPAALVGTIIALYGLYRGIDLLFRPSSLRLLPAEQSSQVGLSVQLATIGYSVLIVTFCHVGLAPFLADMPVLNLITSLADTPFAFFLPIIEGCLLLVSLYYSYFVDTTRTHAELKRITVNAFLAAFSVICSFSFTVILLISHLFRLSGSMSPPPSDYVVYIAVMPFATAFLARMLYRAQKPDQLLIAPEPPS